VVVVVVVVVVFVLVLVEVEVQDQDQDQDQVRTPPVGNLPIRPGSPPVPPADVRGGAGS
jgi:hypothetical protein